MALDSKKLEKFGIVIDDSHEPSVAYISHDLTQCTLHDIRLAYKGQIKFEKVTSNFTSNKNTSEQNNLDIFTEVDQYISETEFIRSAEIALSANDENDAPIVKLFNTLLSAAISKSASDLHIDPVDDRLLIRMRIDGVMTKFTDLDQRVAQMIIARIKLVSNLDITEKRLPQDGRLNVRFKGNSIDIRVATLPTKSGERVVLRFFSNQLTHAEVHDTSLHKTHINSLLSAIANQSGLILVCGPTGSGKTTTIYSLLNTLVGRGLNIMTIEDPVEVKMLDLISQKVCDRYSETIQM
jgi:general secretion pathway protein E